MLDTFIHELKKLNNSIVRLIEVLAPSFDESILDRYIAFRLTARNNRPVITGIEKPDPVRFSELKGIDWIIERLRQNTEQFLRGLPHNNVLLYGPRGTGKSSSVKALLNEYHSRGLRMIEIPRDLLFYISEVWEILKKRREKFIIFCDDLSFDEEERSYKTLKAVLEGGLETKPENIAIYATSNRRHIVPERVKENLPDISENELHPRESLEEKLSLSDRFGLRLGFYSFDQETYLEIISNYISLRNIRVNFESLKKEAIQWALSHGSFSGRTARQFVDDLEGRITG
ncbi:MAG: ATP-binding protein [Thermodesulfovibrionales bacterium]|nr:ATP-binding protein [Thermodesulfovibrionales bacterium]